MLQTLERWGIRGLVAIGLAAAAWILLGTLRSGAADVPKAKDVKAATREALPSRGGTDYRAELAPAGSIAGQGVVEPADREVKVGAPVAAVIRKIFVTEGQRVKAGAALVELDDDVERAEADAAAADLERATADWERARDGKRPEEQRAAVADARAASARLELSKMALDRSRQLKDRGAATPDEFDRARFAEAGDEATTVASLARSDAAQKGWARDVEVAQASFAQARAKLVEAKARLDRQTVKAPTGGTVLQLVVREGEYFNPAGGTPLVVLGDLSTLRVRLDIDERSLAGITLKESGFVTVEAFGGRRFPGHVVEIGRRMGRKNLRTDEPTERIDTRILEVVLQLDDGRELVPGLRAYGYLQSSGK